MTPIVGTPDWQHGVVAANKLLATVASGLFTVDVGIPTNVNRISIVGPVQGASGTMQVLGLTSGILYPGTVIQGTDPVGPSQVYVFRVNPLLDPTVRVSFPVGWGNVNWWVLTETDQSTVTVDQLEILLQANGGVEQQYGLLAMGSDNVHAYVLRTDGLGQLIVTETTLDALAQTIGAVTIAKGILALGTDGTDARAILTDASGHQLTIDSNLALAIAHSNGTQPVDSILVGGSSGTLIRPLATNAWGRLIVMGPDTTTGVVTLSVGGVQLVAAPGTGHNYLHGVDFDNATAAAVLMSLNVGGGAIVNCRVPAGASVSIDLKGYATTTAVTGIGAAASTTATLRYSNGP